MYIVTGASAGIGRAVTAALAARTFDTVAVARSAKPLQSLADRYPNVVRPVVADLSTESGIQAVVAAVSGVPVIRGIVHCAGSLIPLEPYQAMQVDQLIEHFRIHVATPIALYQALARNSRISRMLFVDSYSASSAREGWAAYSIVKAAAQMAARCAAQEADPTLTIRVFPGAVKTRVVDAVLATNTKTAEIFGAMLEQDQIASPEAVAAFIVPLLVDLSDDQIRLTDAWDYNDAAHRVLIQRETASRAKQDRDED